MAKKRSTNVEEAARLADELIAAQAARKAESNSQEDGDIKESQKLEDNDDLNIAQDENISTEDTSISDDYDLSSIEDSTVVENANSDSDKRIKELEHKYSVLQGKYSAETERLTQLLSTTMEELQRLRVQIEDVPSKKDDLSDDESGVENLKEQFPALYKSFLSLARSEAKNEVTKATKGTAEKVDTIMRQSEDERLNMYYGRLKEIVPAWEKINSHPVFLKWLSEMDEFSGTQRKVLLQSAFGRRDPVVTAKFFNAFIKEKGIKVKEKSTIADNIAPGSTGSNISNPSARNNSTKIPRSEISKFYQDKIQGRLSNMSEADIAKQEARYFQAVREGRVI